jgi:hypothetical protein
MDLVGIYFGLSQEILDYSDYSDYSDYNLDYKSGQASDYQGQPSLFLIQGGVSGQN